MYKNPRTATPNETWAALTSCPERQRAPHGTNQETEQNSFLLYVAPSDQHKTSSWPVKNFWIEKSFCGEGAKHTPRKCLKSSPECCRCCWEKNWFRCRLEYSSTKWKFSANLDLLYTNFDLSPHLTSSPHAISSPHLTSSPYVISSPHRHLLSSPDLTLSICCPPKLIKYQHHVQLSTW